MHKKIESSNLDETVLLDDEVGIKTNSRDPYLVIFIGNDSGKRHKLRLGTMSVGRSPQADIILNDKRVSRSHCSITWLDNIITIEDKESRNGTYVDSQKVNHVILTPGVPIQLGNSVMKIEYKNETEIQYEQSLIYKASIDALTRLFNRDHFTSLVLKEIAHDRTHQLPTGIIMIDIDDFKRVNDTYGHGVGDFVLVKIADVIKGEMRTEDLFCRYGGEEFLIFPRGEIETESIFSLCERIRKAVKEFEFRHSEAYVRLTISIGFHLGKPNNGNAKSFLNDLIDKADKALYIAKKKGKNRIECMI